MKPLPLHLTTVVLFALLGVSPVSASLIFNLDSPVVFGAPGTVFDVTGSLLDPDADPVFLNTASGTLSNADLDFEFTNYFVLVPRSLNSGDSYSGPIFSIVVSPTAQAGDYFGSFTIQGGPDESAFDDLATQNFQVTVSNVPEPSTFRLLASVLALLVISVGKISAIGGSPRSMS